MATTPVNPTDLKATPLEQAPASQAWFRYHKGYQTIVDARNPATRAEPDRSADPVAYRTWLQTFENTVLDTV